MEIYSPICLAITEQYQQLVRCNQSTPKYLTTWCSAVMFLLHHTCAGGWYLPVWISSLKMWRMTLPFNVSHVPRWHGIHQFGKLCLLCCQHRYCPALLVSSAWLTSDLLTTEGLSINSPNRAWNNLQDLAKCLLKSRGTYNFYQYDLWINFIFIILVMVRIKESLKCNCINKMIKFTKRADPGFFQES